ncbi:DNA mismatch repair endonuclease MutL [Merismopedia glauca]|uniref:DNA mismatch repair protein MutL n=1 Tax=Merismopedia glauca CCAP 1448/3 TaxID=1296344 RepID=A0A2T1C6E6_9CYAN|nr:DNA mismatch repair endonuclease MutL [Merismopedia glauca]PSB03852.1 DNA mismatch repair endonuclease MutL [Merismopedia glauca CCAP 1448/3]
MNSQTIYRLPTEVVHLIAAGEVIDSLAAVVRELVENALDAGATRISISLFPELWKISVADNGAGMELTDLELAATAHSTSKIHTLRDLSQITSLGFRGEALHSLAQLGSLEIHSRAAGSYEGWRVSYNSLGEVRETEIVALAPGTIVTVSDLFANWASRREALPTIPQQLRALQLTIWQIALCHPHITWQVQLDGRNWLALSRGTTASQILPQILPKVRSSDLQHLSLEVIIPGDEGLNSSSSLQLTAGLPDRCHRHRLDWVKVGINGRIVKAPELEQSIIAGFARTLPRDRYPICFLHLQISPHQIDWNRHPAKAEIYLNQVNYWQEKVVAAIEQVLKISPTQFPESLHDRRLGQILKVAENKGNYQVDPPPLPVESNDEGLIELKAVAQIHNTYIVAEQPTGLWLIEQHIAHERILYEQICDTWELVPIEPALILQNLSSTQVEQLERIGLVIEPFGEQLWAIRTVPAILRERKDCAEAVIELSLGGDLQTAQVAVSCRSAIRNGTPLTLAEMQDILDGWKRTRHPRTCPHGRPIYLSLEETALSKFFRRHWVIGKSHGI